MGITMSDTAGEFADLLARARRGDKDALTQLVQYYEPELRIAARVRLGPALRPYLDSMDLVQSVHRSLIHGLGRGQYDLSSPQKLIALAVTILQRKVARHWKRIQRQQRTGAMNESERQQFLLGLCSPEEDPAGAVAFKDQVNHFLGDLEEMDRRLLELRLEGCTTTEAARCLGVSPGFLRVRLSRLRQRLRDRGLLSDWL